MSPVQLGRALLHIHTHTHIHILYIIYIYRYTMVYVWVTYVYPPLLLHISPYCWCTLFSPRSTSPSVPTSLGFPLRSRFRKTRHSHHRRIPSPKCHSWGHTRHLRCRSPQKSAERVQFPGPNFSLSLSLSMPLFQLQSHDQRHDSNLQYEKYKTWIGHKRLGNNRLTKHPHNIKS